MKRRKRKEEKTGIDAAKKRGSGGKQEGDEATEERR
jgi:hypothetical protein